MIKICDAIMGSGKTSAAITYINQNPDKKFIYLSPYLNEGKRIKERCPNADFIEPASIPSKLTKVENTLKLIEQGRNIVSTHQALARYTPDTMKALKEYKYTIIIDEAVNITDKASYSSSKKPITSMDVELLLNSGYIYESAPNEYSRTDKPDTGCALSGALRLIKSRPLIQLDAGSLGSWCWIFSKEIFEQAEDVIVLTYLFKGSEMEQFLKINDLPYQFIGIRRSDDGTYSLSGKKEYVPKYVGHLCDMIHIVGIDIGREKLNSIGDERFSLSEAWYGKPENSEKIDRLRLHLVNYFKNIARVPYSQRMCGSFKQHWGLVRGEGYYKDSSYVVFNQRSQNDWSDRRVLAYPVNLFLNPFIDRYYKNLGGCLDGDSYALSIMVQWIWRSAIRNGEEIYLYLPSKRMRKLLLDWIQETSKGGEIENAA